MGYDVQFIQVPVPSNVSFPVQAGAAAKLLAGARPFDDAEAVRTLLLGAEGCRRGPDDAIDYLGRGLSYARFSATTDAIHVENNCSPRELLKIYDRLVEVYPTLLILDLQSRQLHNPASFTEWWSKPL